MRLSPAPSLFKNKRKEVPEQAELRRKTGQRGLLITSCKRLEKDSDGPQLLRQRQSVSLHTRRHQAPHKPSSCTTFRLKPHWGRAATGKKVLGLFMRGHFGHFQLFVTLQTVSCQASLTVGASRQQHWSVLANTGCHTLLEAIFPAAPAANSPEDLVLPEPLRPKQLPHRHTWPSQGQTQALQGSLRSKPQWTTHMQRWK